MAMPFLFWRKPVAPTVTEEEQATMLPSRRRRRQRSYNAAEEDGDYDGLGSGSELFGSERGDEGVVCGRPLRWDRPLPAAAALALLTLTAFVSVLRLGGKEPAWLAGGSQNALNTLAAVPTAPNGTLRFAVVATNEYPPVDTTLYPWKIVVEPYRLTRLTAVPLPTIEAGRRGIATAEAGKAGLRWTVTPLPDEGETAEQLAAAAAAAGGGGTLVEVLGDDGGVGGGDGHGASVLFKQAARQYQVTLTAESATGGESGPLVVASAVVMCKYVRRELRQLNSVDRERFLTALEQVHRLPLEEGVRRYGRKFTNYEQQVVKHLGTMTLDGYSRYHNGQVFLTAHFAFSLELEQALQAVDPAVAMPFWDYTIDGATYGRDWQSLSPIFRDDFMGAYPASGAGALSSGRFAWLPIPSDDTFSLPERNAYGRLTDSINPDPAEFVGRSTGMCGLETAAPLPACKELWGVLAADNLDRLQPRVEYGYHGMLHAAVGGYWDCPYSMGELVIQRPNWASILEAVGLQANTLWRGAAIRKGIECPTDTDRCSAGDPIEACSCACPLLDALSDDELTYAEAYAFLDATSAIEMLANNPWMEGLASMVDATGVGAGDAVAAIASGMQPAVPPPPVPPPPGQQQQQQPQEGTAAAVTGPGASDSDQALPRQQEGSASTAAAEAEAFSLALEAASASAGVVAGNANADGSGPKRDVTAAADGAAGQAARREQEEGIASAAAEEAAAAAAAAAAAGSGGGGRSDAEAGGDPSQRGQRRRRLVPSPHGDSSSAGEVLWFTNLDSEENVALVKWLARFVAHPGKMSPFATPLAAPNDPLFGPAHSAYLRLMGYMTLKGHLDTAWTDSAGNGKFLGHGVDDSLPFYGLLRGDPPAAAAGSGSSSSSYSSSDGLSGGYTNRQLVEMMHPANPRLPYLWADFEWEGHCPADEIPAGDRPEAPPHPVTSSSDSGR